jgi:hypothetical protein
MSDNANKAYIDSLTSTVTSTGSMTSSGLTLSSAGHVLLGASFPSLSKEEERELEILEEEHTHNLKIERIRIFKSMPSDMRQNIVNSIIFKKYLAEIESPNIIHSNRLNELRRKDYRLNVYATTDHWGMIDQYSKLLNFLSEEDIINAHAEQSIEEQLLNSSTDHK